MFSGPVEAELAVPASTRLMCPLMYQVTAHALPETARMSADKTPQTVSSTRFRRASLLAMTRAASRACASERRYGRGGGRETVPGSSCPSVMAPPRTGPWPGYPGDVGFARPRFARPRFAGLRRRPCSQPFRAPGLAWMPFPGYSY